GQPAAWAARGRALCAARGRLVPRPPAARGRVCGAALARRALLRRQLHRRRLSGPIERSALLHREPPPARRRLSAVIALGGMAGERRRSEPHRRSDERCARFPAPRSLVVRDAFVRLRRRRQRAPLTRALLAATRLATQTGTGRGCEALAAPQL